MNPMERSTISSRILRRLPDLENNKKILNNWESCCFTLLQRKLKIEQTEEYMISQKLREATAISLDPREFNKQKYIDAKAKKKLMQRMQIKVRDGAGLSENDMFASTNDVMDE